MPDMFWQSREGGTPTGGLGTFTTTRKEGLMRRLFIAVFAIFLIAFPLSASAGGFDQYGYNDTARIFNGPADGVDRSLDGTVWGDPTYASDHLSMKWNAEWDRGNDEGWTDLAGYD